MPYATPPWLVPPDFLGAIRSGAGLGLQVRAQGDAEEKAAETLRQAQESLMLRAQQAQAAQAFQERELAAKIPLQNLQAQALTQSLAEKTSDRAKSAAVEQAISGGMDPIQAFTKFGSASQVAPFAMELEKQKSANAMLGARDKLLMDRQRAIQASQQAGILERNSGMKIRDSEGVVNPLKEQEALQKGSVEQKAINAQTIPGSEMGIFKTRQLVLDKTSELQDLISKAQQKGDKFWAGYSLLAKGKAAAGFDSQDNELAKKILQYYGDVFGVAGFGTAGKNFTGPERVIIREKTGTPNAVDFPSRMMDFRQITADELLQDLQSFKMRGLDRSDKYREDKEKGQIGIFKPAASYAFTVPGALERWVATQRKIGLQPDLFGFEPPAAPTNSPITIKSIKLIH